MPIFEFLCSECGNISEQLVMGENEETACPACGARDLKKLLSAHSAMSGAASGRMPGPGDTACCGSSPGHAGCAGPGSCCGKGPLH